MIRTGLSRQEFFYLGIGSTLKMLLENPVTSRYMFLPSRDPEHDPETSENRSVYDTLGWQQRVNEGRGREGRDPGFASANHGRNIVLSMNMDGFQPWKTRMRSLTPLVCMILNLPENIRHRPEFLILAALIPGPNEPSCYTPYLRMVVDELQQLYNVGLKFMDPWHEGKPSLDAEPLHPREVVAKVKLLYVCADYPAFGDLLHQQTSTAVHGCIKCTIEVRGPRGG
jgi:hypothetical protein